MFINSGIHVLGLSVCLPNFLKVIGGTASLSTTIINLTCIGINLYCIMLQRYNGIRINQLIEKMTPRYERQKDAIKEELRKEDSLLKEHTFKIVDRNKKEKKLTFDEIINTASLSQLTEYRKKLEYIKCHQDCLTNDAETIIARCKKNMLKIDFKKNANEFTPQYIEEKVAALTRRKY